MPLIKRSLLIGQDAQTLLIARVSQPKDPGDVALQDPNITAHARNVEKEDGEGVQQERVLKRILIHDINEEGKRSL